MEVIHSPSDCGGIKNFYYARELCAAHANFRRENDTDELIDRNKDVTQVVIGGNAVILFQ